MQTFNPAKVMVSDTLGKEIVNPSFTKEFLENFVQQSNLVKLGDKVEMGNQRIKKYGAGVGELSDAYFVGEGEKIGTAKVEGQEFTIETKKIAVILPVTEEFLRYTWAQYFDEVIPAIVDKFNRKIDGSAFLGLHGNPFGANVLASATTAQNVKQGGLTASEIYDLEAMTTNEPNAFVGNRKLYRDLQRLNAPLAPQVGQVETMNFERPKNPTGQGMLDGLPYVNLNIDSGETYPDGTLITGNFNSLKYGIPDGTNLRLKISDQATLSKVQNAGPDSGDVHLFEQDMQALRAIFEIGVGVSDNNNFAVLQKGEAV